MGGFRAELISIYKQTFISENFTRSRLIVDYAVKNIKQPLEDYIPVIGVPGTVIVPPRLVVVRVNELAGGESLKPSPFNSMIAPPPQLTRRGPSVERSWKYRAKSIESTSSARVNLAV